MKKFLLAIFALTTAFSSILVHAASPFADVNENDAIYSDLLQLYHKGIIALPTDAKFHPEALMNRDEFVSIVVWVGCKKCLTPSAEDVIKYVNKPFVDFSLTSKYFYCVSYAKEKGIVEGYRLGSNNSVACQDGKTYSETPFCAENRITRIEAAAVLLRQAGLWSETLNSSNYAKSANISDVDSYWYGYAQKSMEIGIIGYKEGTKIYPDEYISKREFVTMASKFFSINLCELKETAAAPFASEIRITDKTATCSPATPATTFPNQSENTYNFIPEITGSGVGLTYEWEFVNRDTKTKLTQNQMNLCPYTLPESGVWIVKLTVKDASGRSSISYSQVQVNTPASELSVSITAKPLSTPAGSTVGFTSQVSGGTAPYTYSWDFGDGNYETAANPSHIFYDSGIYPVSLVVVDSTGKRAYAKLELEVYTNNDYDNDGVLNDADLCPYVYGTKELKGCPAVTEFTPSSGKASFLSTEAIGNECLSSQAFSSWALFGNASCSSCPCEYSLDFLASIRRCDILFPTILSPDKKTSYSRGSVYEVKSK